MHHKKHYSPEIRARLSVFPRDMTLSDRMVYTLLMVCSGPDGCASVGRARLSQLSGLSPHTVKMSMRRLRKAGIIGAAVWQGEGKVYKHPILDFITVREAFDSMVADRPTVFEEAADRARAKAERDRLAELAREGITP